MGSMWSFKLPLVLVPLILTTRRHTLVLMAVCDAHCRFIIIQRLKKKPGK